jgi:hypothetical protein
LASQLHYLIAESDRNEGTFTKGGKDSMKHLSFLKTAACAALLFTALAPRTVRADEWDKKTIVTFSDAVQVPGTILPAGTYVFKVDRSILDRFVVQISNERENHVFTTIIAIPNIHMTAPDKTLFSFYEAPAGQPEPIKAWFYPGDNIGRQFVYSKSEAALIAKATNETVPTEGATAAAQSTTAQDTTQNTAAEQAAVATEPKAETPAPAPTPAPVVTEPEPQPAPVSTTVDTTTTDTTPPAPVVEDQPVQDTSAATEPTTLPSTGSELPLAGLIGLLSISAALVIRAVRSVS